MPLNFRLAEKDAWGSIHSPAVRIAEIGYFLFPSRDIAEISIKLRKSLKQLTTNQTMSLW